MSASWFIMFIQVEPRIFEASPQWPLFVHSWRLWKLLALLKYFRKKKFHFQWVKCYPLYLVGNNFYLNVLSNHRNVNRQQICHVVRLWQRNLSFYVYFCFKTFFICLCIVLFFSLKGVLLYQGCSTAFFQVVDECLVCVRESVWPSSNLLPVLIFSMLLSLTRIDVSFYCDDLMLPNCPFFF